MSRVLAGILLRSGVLWLVPCSVALEVPSYLEGQHLLGSDWTTTTQVANHSVSLLMILAAVAGCLFTHSWRRHSPLLASLPSRGLYVLILPSAMVSVVIAAVHFTYVALVLVRHADGTIGDLELFPFAPVAPALLAFGLIGTVAGTLSPSRLAAPFLGIVLYGFLVVGFGSQLAGLFSMGGAGIELTGMRLDTRFVLAQTLWFSSLAAVVGLILKVARDVITVGRRPGLAISGAIAFALLLAGTAVAEVGARGHEVLLRAEVNWVCLGSSPRLCAIEGHEDQMESASPRIREVFRRLSSVREFPMLDTYRERLGRSDDGSGAGQLAMRDLGPDHDIAFRVIAASYLCSDDWTNDQLEIAGRLASALAYPGLDEQASLTEAERSLASNFARGLRCN